jgi:hypothetical protein
MILPFMDRSKRTDSRRANEKPASSTRQNHLTIATTNNRMPPPTPSDDPPASLSRLFQQFSFLDPERLVQFTVRMYTGPTELILKVSRCKEVASTESWLACMFKASTPRPRQRVAHPIGPLNGEN